MKKKLLLTFVGISFVFSLAACGGSDDSDQAQAGPEKIYDQKCSSCHGENLKGNVGPDLTKVGSRYSKEDILDIIKNGKSGGMPQGLVSGDDADSVAEWLAAKK